MPWPAPSLSLPLPLHIDITRQALAHNAQRGTCTTVPFAPKTDRRVCPASKTREEWGGDGIKWPQTVFLAEGVRRAKHQQSYGRRQMPSRPKCARLTPTGRAVGSVLEEHVCSRGGESLRRGLNHTSGIWIHGDNRKDVVSDTTPITKPIDLQAVIGDPNLNGIVVRPALVYGRTASILAGLFQSASEGKVAWYGTPGGRYCLVHADDLADLYVRAVEKAPILGGQIFDAANDFTESVDDHMQRLTEISDAQSPYEYIQSSTHEQNFFLITQGLVVFETAIGTTVLCRPYLARALLNWKPRKAGLVDGLVIYYAAWAASRQT
ncbi:hypothetical protein BDN71DRAFT_1489922 [Pleurotus eryngii]|uniref:NAD-dependent epimerase/dehydratase domain-containing protein n=1 Tax=Pleurotus eryngii TaxID=5323 RepID=A0A9P5ZRQ7_PLEER|nr:hypothetical protein BDN71DRAFT_1489922 [Pleurotus eryngii]